MKTFKIYFALLLFVASSFAFAQSSSFDKEAASWHKKAVMTCGMLRDMKTFDPQKMLNNLAELSSELKVLQDKYADNPPPEYANDPLWKTYFEDLEDNIAIVKEKVAKKQYRLAQNYCGNFCRIFGRMHKNNGLTDLTDLMFSLRAEIRSTMDMYNAKNIAGAKESLTMIKSLLSKVDEKAKAFENKNFKEAYELLKSTVIKWIEAIEKNDSKSVMENFNSFMESFPKPYGMTL
jgi:hypothetical protein